MAQGIENFSDSGIRVTVKSGMSQRDIDFPDATSYVEDANELRVGTGKPNEHYNYLDGETLGVFNWQNVIALTPL